MSTPDKAPLVEVRNAFDEDYFVAPPPSITSQSTTTPADNSIAAVRKRNLNASRLEQILSNDSRLLSTNVPPSEPVEYTPVHPNLLNKTTTTRQRRTPQRRALFQTDFNNSQQQLQPQVSRPALATSNLATATRPQPMWTRFTAPRILSTPNQQNNNNLYTRPPSQAQTNSSNNIWPNQLPQPRFGSAPNFTTFANSSVQDWQSQFLNMVAQRKQPASANNTPMPAHAHQNINPSGTPLEAHQPSSAHSNPSLLRAPVPRLLKNSRVQNRPAFPSQAMPVRPAYDDFLRQVQTALPNLDVTQFMQQLTSSPNQPIQISVPHGVDTMAVQQQLQKALETTMLQSLVRSSTSRTQLPAHLHQQQTISNNSGPHLPSMIDGILNGNPPPGQPPNNADFINVRPPPVAPKQPNEDDIAEQDEHAGANQDEEYHDVETYADYVPAKLTIGLPHPDPVVETSSLSTVEAPDIYYKLKLPPAIIDKGLLSALQLESVIYACQQHSQMLPDGRTRQGFLIGDGAGVGKGRTIAGIIYENFLCGRRKSIWLSVSTDLKFDAERDLKDIGAKIPVHLLGKFSYGRRINEDFGVIFSTYSGLVSKSQSVRGALGSRIGQLIAWAGNDFDGVIVFDECHKAKNIAISSTAKQSKAASFALDLQNKLPRARVVYASATGASETRHLGYMTRLGIWGKGTAYETFSQFCGSIEKRGVGAMELVAVDLKMRGSYIARQLSFKTTSFEIHVATLDEDFVRLYNECVDMWSTALKHFTEAARYFVDDKRRSRSMWATFWAAHQKFFKYLCIGAKVPLVTQLAKQALEDGKCVVIGLQSTGEAKAMEALEAGDINEFISTAKATFESLVANHFPAPKSDFSRTRCLSPKLGQVKSTLQSTDSSTPSSESTIDTETWVQKDSVSFVLEDGIVKARIADENTAEKTRFSKNKEILEELAREQKSKQKHQDLKSTRALRARRRQALKKDNVKSRIKKLDDDSDTEISNPLSSSNSETLSRSPLASSEDDNEDDTCQSSDFINDDEEDETLTESASASGSSLDEKPKMPYKLPPPRKQDQSDDSDDSDVIITAVKPRKNYEVIMLDTDDEDEEEDDRNDPMVVHGKRLSEMRDELYRMIDKVGSRLPNNTLDDLIDRLGGVSKVAEMTGRKGRIVKDAFGQVLYRQRNDEDALENLNIAEKERFMKGQKLVAIISEAASSGISLQADKRVANKRRRVHITIELPWSADRAIQQFGRTHRSNQLSGPEYVFVISELAGEKRFASIVAKRLESLGALTHGDRRATSESRDLSQFNLNSKYTRDALKYLLRYMETGLTLANLKPDDPKGTFLQEAKSAFIGAGLGKGENNFFNPDSNAIKLNHFLNRLLGMKVQIQNSIFKLFTDYMDRLIARDKVIGQHDAGILELNSESGKTKCDPPENFELDTKLGRVKCSLWHVLVERGISWNEAVELVAQGESQEPDEHNGFYISDNPLTGARMIALAIRAPDVNRYKVYKPNTGRMPKLFHITDLTGVKVSLNEAKELWEKIFTLTDKRCIHMCLFNKCSRSIAKMKCDIGLRHRRYCILSGGILTAWPYLEMKAPTATAKLQIVRLKLDTTNRVIGPVVPQEYVRMVRKILLNADETQG